MDSSSDGQGSHQQRVLRLAHQPSPFSYAGWKEWQGIVLAPDGNHTPEHLREVKNNANPKNWLRGTLSVYRFCHASWAALYRVTHNLEMGKGIILFLAVCSLLLWRQAMQAWLPSRYLGWCIAGAAAFNPVLVCQSLTFFTDSYVAVFSSAGIALVVLHLGRCKNEAEGAPPRKSEGWLVLIGFISCALLLLWSKESGAGVVIFLLLGWMGSLAVLKVPQTLVYKRAALLVLILLIGGGLTALVSCPDWFAPLLNRLPYGAREFAYGSSGKQIDKGASLFLGEKSKMEQLIISIFNKSRMHPDHPRWKWPFTVYSGELMEFQSTPAEIRVGGFGPYFGPVCLFTMLGFGLMIAWARVPGLALLWLVACLFALSYLTPWWWARWNPWFWLLPILILICCLQPGLPRLARLVGGLLLVLIWVDMALVTVPYVRGMILLRGVMQEQLALWKRLPQPLPVQYGRDTALIHRLEDNGITIKPVSGDHFDYKVRARLVCSGMAIYTNDVDAPWVQELISQSRQLEQRLKKFHLRWIIVEVGDEVPEGMERNGAFGLRMKPTTP